MPMRTPILWSEALLNASIAPGQSPDPTQVVHDPLVPRNMYDSYTELILPFGSSAERKEDYINASGGIRMGKLMEHLDSLAGSIAYKHMLGPGVETLGRIQEHGFYIVTASVDRLDMLAPLNPSRDLRLSGQVIHVGKSSMEVAVKMETIGSSQPDETVLLGNAPTSLIVAKENISTPEERSLDAIGAHMKKRRQSGALRSLSRVPPSSTEASALHDFYLQYGQENPTEDASGERIWMGDTRLEKCMLMFPQERNVHQKIFGGYLMRLAYELGFVNASLLARGHLRFLSLDGISFARPVPIGSILRLTSLILHTNTPSGPQYPQLIHVGVKANVVDVKTGSEQTTNDFRLTWCRDEGDHEGIPRKVVPKTYREAMLWLEGSRALELGAEIRGLRQKMPLRLIRTKVPRVNSQDVLQLATAATALTKELSNMSFFPPATAAVSIVLLILQTVQNNKEACFRLVRRCARILLDINEQMEGRWETAPPTLLRNLEKFQHTLYSINEFMKSLTDAPWSHRFMKKTSIDNAIVDYTGQLDDAAQSFQIAALIDIHYAVSQRSREQNKAITNAEPSLASPPPPYRNSGTSIVSNDDFISSISDSRSDSLVFVESPVEMQSTASILSDITDELVGEPEEEYEMISDDVLDARGFRRYHQSEVRLKGRTNLKGGWWGGASPVEVEGQSALIKRYEGPAEQGLMMVGLSEGGAPTPFILLSHGKLFDNSSDQPRILTSGLSANTDPAGAAD
ncbi:hypothetical protein H0H93_001710 [Arthromyces matolae]|nr:hypothetical protein H0H93_001710 [Arthromyces matolae]